MAEKEKLVKIGALWIGKSQGGVGYMSGVIQDSSGNDIRVIVFKNGYKEEDKHPDYVVYLSKEREQAKKPEANGKPAAKGAKGPKKGDDAPPF
jgi:hypothetical protein